MMTLCVLTSALVILCCYGLAVVEGRAHGNLRLVEGSNYRQGRVEVYISSDSQRGWGTVCDDFWDAPDARVVCKQLGFGATGSGIQEFRPSAASRVPIWLDNVRCDGFEPKLINCQQNTIGSHDCSHSEDAGVNCGGDFPRLPIRLVDGRSTNEGRVEIYYKNSWATICDDGWDNTDASVVCRQLGFSPTGTALHSAAFGQGSGTILLTNVTCATEQSNIFDCHHDGFENHNCSHGKDAGVRCLSDNILVRLVAGRSHNEGRVEVNYNGGWGTVCDDGWDDTDAGVVCRQLGFGSSGTALYSASFGEGPGSIWLDNVLCSGDESTLAGCGHLGVGVTISCSHREDAGVRCSGTQIVPVRLSGGTSVREGRVEMFFNNQWGTVCDDLWSVGSSSAVVCKQLGLGSTGDEIDFGAGPSYFPILLDDVVCDGTEANILACPHLRLGSHNCFHGEDVGVRCSGLYNAPIRLTGGTNKREGFVEIMYQGIWGTICDSGWDDIDATVVCRELGYGDGTATRQAQFGPGSGPVWLSQVGCLENESKLSHCIHNGAGNVGSCSHAQDAGVICNNVNVRLVNGPTRYEGRVEVYHNGEWGTVCDDGWDLNDAQVVCSELGLGKAVDARHSAFFGQGSGRIWLDDLRCVGNEQTIGSCSHIGWGNHNCGHGEDASVNCSRVEPLSNGTLRVVGPSANGGRVEIYFDGRWNTICNDGWDDTDAGVVCRQLGFGSSGVTLQPEPGRGLILLNDVNCFGNESSLLNCGHNGIGISDCDHNKDAGVNCTGSIPALPIKLADGGTPYSGRVEIYRNGVWGTVCDDNWDYTIARLVCQQLGLGTSGSVDSNVPAGTGPILMDNVQCDSGQTNLLTCSHNGFGNHDCSHDEDVGVVCYRLSTPVVRLEGGSSYNEGRVEVNYNGEWGTVCNNGWDDTDAGVVCRQLGFGSSGTATSFSQGSGPILLDSVTCSGSESTLASCGHLGVGVTRSCSHREDAGVRCTGITGTILRLVGGGAHNEGRVEVNYNGEWGTVCDDGWDDTDAGVVCRQLGFGSSGTAVYSVSFGQGSGPILLDSVTCSGNESTLASCGHLGVGVTRSCSHSEDAGVRCTQEQGLLFRLVGGSSYTEGRVEVNYNGEWGTVCDDGWDDTDAGVVCRQLGFGSSGTAIGSATFGQGSGPILLDSVTCSGSESTLASCGHLGVNVTRSCYHWEDAGVRCDGNYRFHVRVVPQLSNNIRQGRVEVFINGIWGLVCVNDWDTFDATVVCQETNLGTNGTAYQVINNGMLWLSGVGCVGNESHLSQCPHSGIGVMGNCDQLSGFAGVNCFGGVPVITSPPQNQTIGIITGDESVTFTCLAEGEGLLYSWQRQGSQFPLSTTTHTLVISGVREEDSGNYRCIVENRFGPVTSDYALLNVTVRPPIVTIDPYTTITKVFGSVVFNCSAVGFGEFSYAWNFNLSLVVLSNEPTFVIDRVLPQQRGEYRCTVTSSYMQLSSSVVATLSVKAPSFSADVILRQISSNASTNTITVSIPEIDESDGPISHFYIVVSVEKLEHTNAIKESDLLPSDQETKKKRNSVFPFYVTASVTNSISSPVTEFTIGSGSDTSDSVTGRQFYNAPLQQDETYYYFIRAYSEAHTPAEPFFGTSNISPPIGIKSEANPITGSSSSSSSPIPIIIGVVVALMIVVVIICIVIATILIRKRKKKTLSVTNPVRRDLTNPTYDAKLCASNKEAKTLPDYEDHVYDTIKYASKEEKQEVAPLNKAPLNQYQNFSHAATSENQYQNFSHAATRDADRMSITSDDVPFDEPSGYCTSNVKENKVQYSKKSKPQPPPRQKNSTAKVSTSKIPAETYDVPSTPAISVGNEYAALGTTHTNTAVDNNYQELVVHRVPPGYDVPRNTPTTTTLKSYHS